MNMLLDKYFNSEKRFQRKKDELETYLVHIDDHIKECLDLINSQDKHDSDLLEEIKEYENQLLLYRKELDQIDSKNFDDYEKRVHRMKYMVLGRFRSLDK